MRILMLNIEFPPVGGGAATAMENLLKEFAKTRIPIDVVTASPGKDDVIQFSKYIRIVRLGIGKKHLHYWSNRELATWTWRAYRATKELLSKNKYDVMHCWFGFPPGLIGYLFRSRVPYIVGLRGSDVPGYSARTSLSDPFLKPLYKRIWSQAKAVVVNSLGLKKLAEKTLENGYHIIYNGVAFHEFLPKKYTRRGVLKIICVGRLVERKGFGYLVQALEGLPVAVTLVGDGPMKDSLQNLAKSSGVNVRFVGQVSRDRVKKELAKADVFCLPSLNEGSPETVVEAMAAGLPIIATDVGGTAELVDRNGIVVRPGSVVDLRKAVEYYLETRSHSVRHGRRSRRLAKKMSWKDARKQYQKVY